MKIDKRRIFLWLSTLVTIILLVIVIIIVLLKFYPSKFVLEVVNYFVSVSLVVGFLAYVFAYRKNDEEYERLKNLLNEKSRELEILQREIEIEKARKENDNNSLKETKEKLREELKGRNPNEVADEALEEIKKILGSKPDDSLFYDENGNPVAEPIDTNDQRNN